MIGQKQPPPCSVKIVTHPGEIIWKFSQLPKNPLSRKPMTLLPESWVLLNVFLCFFFFFRFSESAEAKDFSVTSRAQFFSNDHVSFSQMFFCKWPILLTTKLLRNGSPPVFPFSCHSSSPAATEHLITHCPLACSVTSVESIPPLFPHLYSHISFMQGLVFHLDLFS